MSLVPLDTNTFEDIRQGGRAGSSMYCTAGDVSLGGGARGLYRTVVRLCRIVSDCIGLCRAILGLEEP